MTERRTNRLIGAAGRSGGQAPPFVTVNDAQVPTDIHDYCGWLNNKERRRGLWVVAEINGVKAVDWCEEVASDAWLRERGMAPRIGQAA